MMALSCGKCAMKRSAGSVARVQCRPRVNAPVSPSSFHATAPMRVMMRMLSTT